MTTSSPATILTTLDIVTTVYPWIHYTSWCPSDHKLQLSATWNVSSISVCSVHKTNHYVVRVLHQERHVSLCELSCWQLYRYYLDFPEVCAGLCVHATDAIWSIKINKKSITCWLHEAGVPICHQAWSRTFVYTSLICSLSIQPFTAAKLTNI